MRVLLLALSLTLALPTFVAAQDDPGDAYLDAAARELVRQARARRVTTDRRIQSYQTDAVERVSVGLRVGIGEKLLYRRETASRIDWKRDGPVNIEVVGAREVLPAVSARPQVPFDLARYVPHLAFDPIDSEMLLRFDTTVIRHPLAAGSETHYRFGSGDSTVIQLPDGRAVRLLELRIIPRRRDEHLIRGSFWLDAETHAVVQAYFRLSRDIAVRDGDAPPFLNPIGAELDYIAIDYGLWDLRWWLPRTVAARGVMQAGMIRMPMSYERRYEQYQIQGDTTATAPVPGEAPVMDTRPCRPPPIRMTIAVGREGPPDTTSARFRRMRARQAARDSVIAERRRAAGADSAQICDRQFTVTMADTASLLNSTRLPVSIYDSDTEIIDAEELRAIADRVGQIPEPPWQLTSPLLQWGLKGPGLVRYNRVEGLSLGARTLLDLGRIETDGEVRFGFADKDVGGELGVTHKGDDARLRVAGYHRLDVVDFTGSPFSLTSSLNALLFGSNDVGFFRASGAELRITPPSARTQWYELRLFAERQRGVVKNTDFSLWHVIKDDRVFRENPGADAADQIGGVLRLRTSLGVDPRTPRTTAQLELHGETGDYDFLRPRLTLRTSVPLTTGLAIGAEIEGATTFGDGTVQRAWHIGGSSTVRGYSTSALLGNAFWRARLELGLGLPIVRLTPFADAGWAGRREDIEYSTPLRALGIGASFMDALIRIDVAKALDQQRGWKLHVYLNSVL